MATSEATSSMSVLPTAISSMFIVYAAFGCYMSEFHSPNEFS